MILDRALTPALLDIALRVATEAGGRKDARQLLTIALRDHVSAQEAEGKTKKCLSHVWVHPPEPAREMIHWAIKHQDIAPDRAVLHLGAILATFPFAGAVAAIAGRQLHLDGSVDSRLVREEARAVLGDRSTIDVGARKVITTLRNLGLLGGSNGHRLSLGSRPVVPRDLAGWMRHSVMLTRQATAVGVESTSRALELATLTLENVGSGGYALLEIHAEGRRPVAVARLSPDLGSVARSQQ